MKVTDYSPLGKPGATGKKKGVSGTPGGEFLGLLSANETESAGAPPPVGDAPAVSSMDALLTLQEMPEDEIRKRRAVEQSKGTLEALETLRHALLTGSIPEHLLHTLTKVVALQKQRVDDPKLKSVIEDIELRAAVELAKLERARASD